LKPYYEDSLITLYHGDCLEIMPLLDLKVDMILCDLPYGTTACSWDTIIPFDLLWENYDRLIKDKGAVVLTASQPFTTKLISSNFDNFKYEWIWDKEYSSNFYMANKRPLQSHENIVVFGGGKYYPQMTEALMWNMRDRIKNNYKACDESIYGKRNEYTTSKDEKKRYPRTVYNLSSQAAELHKDKRMHPTQKPVPLFMYLIKTYTLPNEIVFDNCVGSGTTMVACKETGRRCIAIEKEEKYCEISAKRCGQEVLNFGGNF